MHHVVVKRFSVLLVILLVVAIVTFALIVIR